MRKRLIDPNFWTNGIIGKLDYKTQLLYIGLWNLADSNGIVENDEDRIKVSIFPYKRSPISRNIQKLVELKKIIPYEVDKKKYLLIKNFKKWQKESHPTYSYPVPPNFQKTPEEYRKVWKPPT